LFMIRMKQVIVLIDNEQRKSPFLTHLGERPGSWPSTLCRLPTIEDTHHFLFEKFGLITKDPKLSDFIARQEGIIIIFEYNQIPLIKDRLTEIVQRSPSVPTLFISEKYHPEKVTPIDLEKCYEFTRGNNRKCFFIDYTHNQYKESIV